MLYERLKMHRKESDRDYCVPTRIFERRKVSDRGNCAPNLFFERLKTSGNDNYAPILFFERQKRQRKQGDKDNYAQIQNIGRPNC
jgi:hypothetical protein